MCALWSASCYSHRIKNTLWRDLYKHIDLFSFFFFLFSQISRCIPELTGCRPLNIIYAFHTIKCTNYWFFFIWVSEQYFSYIIAITNDNTLDYNYFHLVRIWIVLAHWNNSPWIDMLLHWDTLSWFRANQSLLLLLKVAYLVEKQHIPIV